MSAASALFSSSDFCVTWMRQMGHDAVILRHCTAVSLPELYFNDLILRQSEGTCFSSSRSVLSQACQSVSCLAVMCTPCTKIVQVRDTVPTTCKENAYNNIMHMVSNFSTVIVATQHGRKRWKLRVCQNV